MADETTGTQDGQNPGGTAPDTGTPPGGAPAPTTGTFTKDDVDRAAAEARRAEQKRIKDLQAENATAQARLAEFEAADKARQDAELTEVEKARKLTEEAQKKIADAEARAHQAEIGAMRAGMLSQVAQGLPSAYQRQVTGEEPEAIKASIAEWQEAWDKTRQGVAKEVIAELLTATPDQIEKTYGDAGKALAQLLAGQPLSIGGAPPHGASGANTGNEGLPGLAAVAQLPPGPEKQRELLGLMTGKPG
jgi:hypothetical protein